MKKILEFFKSIKGELAKVTWISSRKLVKLTVVVLSISIIAGIMLQFIDIAFQYIIKNYL